MTHIEPTKKGTLSMSESAAKSHIDCEDDSLDVELTEKFTLADSESATNISENDSEDDSSVVELTKVSLSESLAERCDAAASEGCVLAEDEESCSESSIEEENTLKKLDEFIRDLRSSLKRLKPTSGETDSSTEKVAPRELRAALQVVDGNIRRAQALADEHADYISRSTRALKLIRKLNGLVRATNKFIRSINKKKTDTQSATVAGLRPKKRPPNKKQKRPRKKKVPTKRRKRGRDITETSEAGGEGKTTARPAKKLRKYKKGNRFACHVCKREFKTDHGMAQHCRAKHPPQMTPRPL